MHLLRLCQLQVFGVHPVSYTHLDVYKRQAEGLAAAMLETLADVPDRDRLRQRAQDYTLATVVDRYLELFDRLKPPK